MMESIKPNDEDRGQVGIGTLIVFIAMVLVAAIAAGVLINTAGFLQSQSEETGEQSSSQVTNRLQMVSAVGENISSSQVNTVNLTMKKAPGADDVDMGAVTAQWVSDNTIADLVYTDASGESGADGTFTIAAIQDDDGSISNSDVLNSPEDRVIVSIPAWEFGAPGEGDQVSVQITTQAGGQTTATLTVPESLSGKSAVEL